MNKPAKIEKPNGVVDIRGKEYQTVALRVQLFREQHPDYALLTEVKARDAECVVVQAQIQNETGFVLATGHAEEYRKASQINRTSALENAETSAIGRALAALGFGGTEFATANEVQNAVHQQDNPTTGEDAPKKRVELAGPYKSPSALQKALREFVNTLNGIDDLGGYIAFMETPEVVELCTQCERDFPEWWETGEGQPAEFVPFVQLIHNRKLDLEASEEAHAIRAPIRAG